MLSINRLAAIGAALLTVTAGVFPAKAQNDTRFDTVALTTLPADHQIILTGHLRGEARADILVVSDHAGTRDAWLYADDGSGWAPERVVQIGDDIAALDLLHRDGKDELLALAADGLYRIDLAGGDPEPLARIEISADWLPESLGVLDMSPDLNGDGLEDLLLPAAEGLSVMIRQPDGQFADPVPIGWADHARRPAQVDGYRHDLLQESRTRIADLDGDGRLDLAQWRGDRLAVFSQTEDGGFSEPAWALPLASYFDSDDPAYLVAPGSTRYRKYDHGVEGQFTGRVFDSLTDLTGDGIPDLSVFVLRGEHLLDVRYGYAVHAGVPAEDGGALRFEAEATAFERRGIPFGLAQHALTGRAGPDVALTVFKPDPFGIAVGLIRRSMTFHVELHAFAGDAVTDRPVARLPIRVAGIGETGETAVRFSPVRAGDFDGDGQADLLIGQHGRGFDLYFRLSEPGREAGQAIRIDYAFDPSRDELILDDLDGDGAADLILHAPDPIEPGRLTLHLMRLDRPQAGG